MGDKTGIQWTDATWNPLRARHRESGAEGWACVRVSPGCVNCYAATLNESQRWNRGTGLDYTVPALAQVEHYLHEETLTEPLRWKRPRRVFVCSMTDLFGEWDTDEQLDRIFAVMALTPQHTYQVLTKRPERMRAYLTDARTTARVLDVALVLDQVGGPITDHEVLPWPLPNVWIGVSVEDQARASERIPLLLQTPAAVRFLSCEPLLGPLDLTSVPYLVSGYTEPPYDDRIDWVIVGGESGPHARPFDLAWARSIVQQCRAAGVAVFVKQLGAKPVERKQMRQAGGWSGWDFNDPISLRHNHGGNPDEWPEDLRVREWPAVVGMPA